MTLKFDFAEWLKQEMTTAASVGGGGTFTNDVAQFARPLFSGEAVKRKWANESNDDPEDKKKHKKHKKD